MNSLNGYGKICQKKKSNIDEVNKLDEVISHLLKKNNQQNVCTPDTTTNENSK